MRRMRIALLLAALAGILLVSSALAMASANYRIDWYVPLTGGGLHDLASTNYGIYATYGQTAIKSMGSPNYLTGLGFWHGILQGNIEPPSFLVQLPIVVKH